MKFLNSNGLTLLLVGVCSSLSLPKPLLACHSHFVVDIPHFPTTPSHFYCDLPLPHINSDLPLEKIGEVELSTHRFIVDISHFPTTPSVPPTFTAK